MLRLSALAPAVERPNAPAAGTFRAMDSGLGFAIAASVVDASRRVVAVERDSAFGFSGMEVEVACRYDLPVTFIVLDNPRARRKAQEFRWHTS